MDKYTDISNCALFVASVRYDSAYKWYHKICFIDNKEYILVCMKLDTNRVENFLTVLCKVLKTTILRSLSCMVKVLMINVTWHTEETWFSSIE